MIEFLSRLLLNHPGRITFVKYVAASGISLAVDLAVFFALLKVGTPAVVAAALSYSSGILIHWAISSRVVFAHAASNSQAARTYQKLLFVVSALIGLGITSAIVALGTAVHVLPQYAKVVAIIASFFATWLMRKKVVFGDRISATTRELVQAFRLRTGR